MQYINFGFERTALSFRFQSGTSKLFLEFVYVLVCVLKEFVTENHETSTVLYDTVHIYADTVHMYAGRIANYFLLSH